MLSLIILQQHSTLTLYFYFYQSFSCFTVNPDNHKTWRLYRDYDFTFEGADFPPHGLGLDDYLIWNVGSLESKLRDVETGPQTQEI